MKKLNNSIEYIGNELHLFKNAHNWKNYFSTKIGSHIGGDVLEVGAGIGINSKYLFSHAMNVQSWTLLEPDSELCAEIETTIKDIELPRVQIVNGTLGDLKNKCYDTIIYIDVLEHIGNPTDEFRAIKSNLKIGGKVIFLVPAYNFLYNSFDKNIGHFRRYSKSQILMENNSLLQPSKMFYLDSVGLAASILNKFLLKKDLPSKRDVLFWDRILVRFSLFFDVFTFRTFGKSLIAIFEKNEE